MVPKVVARQQLIIGPSAKTKAEAGRRLTVQGSVKRWSPGCVNAAGKVRQKW